MFRNTYNMARRLRQAAVPVLTLTAGSVMAAVPEAVSTELGTLKADVTTIAGLAFAAFLVIVAFKYFRRSAS